MWDVLKGGGCNCEVNPPGLYLGAAGLNNAHAVIKMGRDASSTDEKSKGMWEVQAFTWVQGLSEGNAQQAQNSDREMTELFVYTEFYSWIKEFIMSFMSKHWSLDLNWSSVEIQDGQIF